MDPYTHIVSVIALTMGAAWASGINLYAAILVLGLLGSTGNIVLPPDLQMLTNPMVIGAAALMYVVEFFADKVPGGDTGWDTLQTFVRIPGGALLAAGAVGPVNPAVAVVAGILGGTLAAGVHATKTGTRILINTSPEPVTNWIVSLAEDAMVVVGLWTALHHPWVFVGLLIVFVLMMIWLLPRIWRGVKRLFAAIRRLFTGSKPQTPPMGPIPGGPPLIEHGNPPSSTP